MASRIAELATQISSNSQRIDDYLAANKLPPPSFDEDGPVKLNLSIEIERARSAVLNATAELQALLQGPDQLLRPIVRFRLCLTYLSHVKVRDIILTFSTVERHQP
jgi:hypothetical protein